MGYSILCEKDELRTMFSIEDYWKDLKFNYISILVVFFCIFLLKVIRWAFRIRQFRKQMPAIPVLFPPLHFCRVIWPKKFQTFHYDWYLHSNQKGYRGVYRPLGSDVFALVSLFGTDYVCISDPEV